jgi:hypothetical protein
MTVNARIQTNILGLTNLFSELDMVSFPFSVSGETGKQGGFAGKKKVKGRCRVCRGDLEVNI